MDSCNEGGFLKRISSRLWVYAQPWLSRRHYWFLKVKPKPCYPLVISCPTLQMVSILSYRRDTRNEAIHTFNCHLTSYYGSLPAEAQECHKKYHFVFPRWDENNIQAPQRDNKWLLWDNFSSRRSDILFFRGEILSCCGDLITRRGEITISPRRLRHYTDVTMSPMASQITSLGIVYSTVYSSADQRKHKSSASLAFVRRIHRWPVNSPHKRPAIQKMFPFDDVIMISPRQIW